MHADRACTWNSRFNWVEIACDRYPLCDPLSLGFLGWFGHAERAANDRLIHFHTCMYMFVYLLLYKFWIPSAAVLTEVCSVLVRAGL